MPLYFLVMEHDFFLRQARPALSDCWNRRSFAPCRELCHGLAPRIRRFAEKHHINESETLLHHVACGLQFGRDAWRCLVGEVLLFAATEVPEIETAPETLRCLLAPGSEEDVPRQRFAAIQQVHFGTRDLVFGTAYYRPEHAGWNDVADVARLSAYLDGVDPDRWRADDLEPLTELSSEEDRVEELAYVCDWFPALQDLYRRARERQQIIVCEVL
jgi:hypothetical protein